MPFPLPEPVRHERTISTWLWRRTSGMALAITEPAGSNDIRARVAATILASNQVLSRTLKPQRLPLGDAVTFAELLRIR
ncbi:hypothetical protein GCM10011348_15870 [Marinobacterium nitratireducens]|uniref:Uncharacterized protein n=2 Tax=Marinobacterium nitratireducens TaxID=518897 RepID=A0A917ZDW9_9GAMM|nr:hypothetical protein GCM10011348_15870 [Marinobacterium nitratireducens]